MAKFASAIFARSSSWVAMMTVAPSLARWRMRSMTIWRLALSSEAVGSSAYNTSACLNMARAKPIGPNNVVSHHQTTPTRAPACARQTQLS